MDETSTASNTQLPTCVELATCGDTDGDGNVIITKENCGTGMMVNVDSSGLKCKGGECFNGQNDAEDRIVCCMEKIGYCGDNSGITDDMINPITCGEGYKLLDDILCPEGVCSVDVCCEEIPTCSSFDCSSVEPSDGGPLENDIDKNDTLQNDDAKSLCCKEITDRCFNNTVSENNVVCPSPTSDRNWTCNCIDSMVDKNVCLESKCWEETTKENCNLNSSCVVHEDTSKHPFTKGENEAINTCCEINQMCIGVDGETGVGEVYNCGDRRRLKESVRSTSKVYPSLSNTQWSDITISEVSCGSDCDQVCCEEKWYCSGNRDSTMDITCTTSMGNTGTYRAGSIDIELSGTDSITNDNTVIKCCTIPSIKTIISEVPIIDPTTVERFSNTYEGYSNDIIEGNSNDDRDTTLECDAIKREYISKLGVNEEQMIFECELNPARDKYIIKTHFQSNTENPLPANYDDFEEILQEGIEITEFGWIGSIPRRTVDEGNIVSKNKKIIIIISIILFIAITTGVVLMNV
tara:strand:- start:2983 stop:4545 length:1563 start_codon:yes stop_codon:yes gene_type:complete